MVQDVYDFPESCTAVRRVLVYGILYHLYAEYNCYPFPGIDVANYKKYSIQCKAQLEMAMNQLDLLTPPSHEHIMALVLSVSVGRSHDQN